jgi:hypothetical protein
MDTRVARHIGVKPYVAAAKARSGKRDRKTEGMKMQGIFSGTAIRYVCQKTKKA